MSKTSIHIDKGPITQITLQSPKGLNLLQQDIITELTSTLLELKAEPELRVVILTGGDAKAFCAGADMKELLTLEKHIPYYVELGQHLIETIWHFPVPVIAAINGYALGAGFSLAMACDLRVLAESAKIGQLAVKNGLVPPFGNVQHIMQAVGPLKARELIYTGRILKAQDALDVGLVNQVCPDSSLLESAQALATEIASSPDHVIRQVKSIINQTLQEGFAVGYQAQEQGLIDTLEHPQSRQILEDFLSRS